MKRMITGILITAIAVTVALCSIVVAFVTDAATPNRPQHVVPDDLLVAKQLCKDHEGVSSVSYTNGLSISCNNTFRVSNYIPDLTTPTEQIKERKNDLP